MYFLKCVDYICGTKLENSQLIQNIQNAHSFATAIICGTGLTYYAYYSAHAVVPFLQKLILIKCSFDLFLTTKHDIFIHRLITVSMCYFSLTHLYSVLEIVHFQSAVIISSELSSFFLEINEYLDGKSKWVYACFLSVFFYTRVYLLTTYLFFDKTHLDFLISFLDTTHLIWYNLNIYSFLCINLYWSSTLVKTFYTEIRYAFQSIHTFKNNERLLQYTYFISPIISVVTYGSSNMIFLVDIFGQIVLATNSYRYHNAVYEKLKTQKDTNVCDKSLYRLYVADILSIQLRTFLVVFVNLLQIENVRMGSVAIYYVATVHLIVLYFFYEFIFDLNDGNRVILHNGEKTVSEYLMHLPVFQAILIGFFHNNDSVAGNHVVISGILITIILMVQPFYELNHFFLHIILLYQTYAISACNASLLM